MRLLPGILLVPALCFSQARIDSLHGVLKTTGPNATHRVQLLIDLSNSHKKNSALDSAFFYSRKAIRLSRQIKSDKLMGDGFNMMGNLYFYQHNYTDAFRQYSRADSVYEQNDSLRISRQHAQIYNHMGYAVRLTHGYDKALEYYLKAKKTYQALNSESGMQELNVALAQAYTNQKQYDKALPLINEAMAYLRANKKPITYSIIVRGYLLVQMGRLDEAKRDYDEYYKIAFAGNDNSIRMNALKYMGYLHSMRREYDLSEKYFKRALEMAGTDLNKKSIYEDYIEMLKNKGDFKKVEDIREDYIELRDTLEKDDRSKEIYELETQYRTREKEQQIKTLAAENQLAESEQKLQRYVFLGLIALILIAAAALAYSYRNKIRTARKLKEISELKSRFFANISHEFRTPLTLIKSPLQSLENSGLDTTQKDQLHLIDRNANRMLELVNQLLELSRLDDGQIRLMPRKGEPDAFLTSLTEPFHYEARSQGIVFESDIEKTEGLYEFDPDVLEKIVTNLLSNAFKHQSGEGPVALKTRIDDQSLKIEVSNPANHLKQEELKRVFERFYQKTQTQNSSGIGLALVKELVGLYQGNIQSSLKNNRLSFQVALPLPKAASESTTIQHFGESELPIVLIVDDNPEIRKVVRSVFESDFRILEAADGLEALETARREIPDVIISDVMMPRLDGLEFASRIKQEELTSAIPLVMLTALTSDLTRLQALERSADAYLTKPFRHEILKSTVTQLLNERRKLQERYSRELVLKPVDLPVNSADEKFVLKLQSILDKEIANPDFSSDDFATAAGMSRMQLHRKLKGLLGVSASEFLRTERLKAAGILLNKGGLQISEVAYAVGFNDVSYFSKSFREQYGCTPSEYQKTRT